MRVNYQGKWLDDPAFSRAGFKLKMHKLDVHGRMLALYRYCLEQRTAILTMEDVDGIAEREGFATVLVAVGIAQEKRSRTTRKVPRVSFPAIVEELKWLIELDIKRSKANEARRSQGTSQGKSQGSSNSELVHDPVPAAALAPEREHEQQQQEQQAAEQQQQGSPAVRSGWTPPAGGLADREAKRRIASGEITSADVAACWEYCEQKGVTLDARAAKLIAIQKPKRKAPKSNAAEISESDDPYLEKLDWMR